MIATLPHDYKDTTVKNCGIVGVYVFHIWNGFGRLPYVVLIVSFILTYCSFVFSTTVFTIRPVGGISKYPHIIGRH